jgi:hypothetical protein
MFSRWAVVAIVALLALPAAATATPPHFQCYQGDPGAFSPHTLTITDAFGTFKAIAAKHTLLCAPAQKNAEPAPKLNGAHLDCYDYSKTSPAFKPRPVTITNQFGPKQPVRVIKRLRHCLPAGKRLKPSPKPPKPAGLDAYSCYQAESPQFEARTVDVRDQFGKGPHRLLTLEMLCNPVLSTKPPGPKPIDARTRLACYQEQTSQVTPVRTFLLDAWGLHQFVIARTDSLCVPSTVP